MYKKTTLDKERYSEKGVLTSKEEFYLKEYKRENRELLKTLSKL